MAEALLVIDKQNDFEADGGRLTVGNQARETTPYVVEQVRSAVSAGQLVILSLDTHAEDDPEFHWTGRHSVKGEWGWELVEPLKLLVEGERRAGRVIHLPLGALLDPETALLMEANRLTGKGMIALVEKRTPDLFHDTAAADLFRVWRVNRARITGQMIHLSLFHTAARVRFLQRHPVVLSRGIAGQSHQRIGLYLEEMRRHLGAEIEE